MDNQWWVRFVAGWVIVILGLIVVLFIFYPVIAGLLVGLCVVIGAYILYRRLRKSQKDAGAEQPKKEIS